MQTDEQLVMDAERFAPRCLALISRIRRTGEEVVLTARGKPVARISPILPADEARDMDDDWVVWDVEAVGP